MPGLGGCVYDSSGGTVTAVPAFASESEGLKVARQQEEAKAEVSNSDRRRAAIVYAAARLFDRYGYHNTTMEDLARAIGLSKPTIYYYFGSKNEILFSIHEAFIDILLSNQEARLERRITATANILEIMQDVMHLLDTHPGHLRVFFEHQRELIEPHRKLTREKRDRFRHLLEEVVRRGIQSGEFRVVDPPLAVFAILGMCNWSYQWYTRNGRLSTEEIARGFLDMILSGIKADD
jgi:AcrR family transcriptional regulator